MTPQDSLHNRGNSTLGKGRQHGGRLSARGCIRPTLRFPSSIVQPFHATLSCNPIVQPYRATLSCNPIVQQKTHVALRIGSLSQASTFTSLSGVNALALKPSSPTVLLPLRPLNESASGPILCFGFLVRSRHRPVSLALTNTLRFTETLCPLAR